MKQKYEYTTSDYLRQPDPINIERLLNEKSKDGWEFLCLGKKDGWQFAIFRREIGLPVRRTTRNTKKKLVTE